jgi:DNA repair protein SbcC/Rad50
MRFITFQTIEIKNFLSFGDKSTVINFKPGVNTITGTNLDKEDSKNGCGKSSICDALYYALYGTTLREVGKEFISNALTKKQCEVSLVFDVDTNNNIERYKVTRKLNPTKCSLFKNDEDITRSTLAKTNAFLQNLIHTPATVFQNSVIMSVNNALPFMALPKTDRRKFIESVLGLEVFTSMVLKARDDHSILKKDYEVAYTQYDDINKQLEFNNSQLTNYEELKAERISKQEGKKTNLVRDIEILKERINNLVIEDATEIVNQIELKEIEVTDLQDKLTELNNKLINIQAEINSENKQIKQLSDTKDSCPTCNRDYSDEHVLHVKGLIATHEENISKYKKAESKVDKAIKKLVTEQSNVQAELKVLKQSKRDNDDRISDKRSLSISLDHLEKNLTDVESEIANIQREHNNELKGKISTLNDSVVNQNDKVQKLNNELNVLETVKFVISEEGIKSFLVKKILKVLNSRLAYYLKKLETNCLCQFNEFFDEVIIDENSQPKSYFNFSGGERKRIDLACLFAFADIRRLQGDVNFSTVFYDELLDSSLDDKGVHLTLKILRDRFQENNESCYIVTHRGTHIITKAEHTIHVTKRNGISSISC